MNVLTRFSVAIALAFSILLWVASAGAAERSPSLYERLGGTYAIATVVDAFIERLLVNETLNANPAIDAARRSVPKAGLKYHVTSFMVQATGGPEVYIGRPMKAAHVHLNITDGQWDAMAADFQTVLDRFEVPKAEQEELFALVGTVKPDIVTDQSTASPEEKIYVGLLGEGAVRDPGHAYEDIFTFKDGKFHSAACDPWDFSPGPYTTSAADGVIRFESETTSPSEGRMVWTGARSGERLEGTMQWYPQPDAEPVVYWFSGTEESLNK